MTSGLARDARRRRRKESTRIPRITRTSRAKKINILTTKGVKTTSATVSFNGSGYAEDVKYMTDDKAEAGEDTRSDEECRRTRYVGQGGICH